MKRIDVYFLIAAASFLLVGVSLGIWMGMSHDFAMRPVHAHLNLVGWASLGLFGLIYRSYPELAARRLARVHFGLAVTGAAFICGGLPFTLLQITEAPTIIGSLLWLAGCLTFLYLLVATLLRTPAPRATAIPAE